MEINGPKWEDHCEHPEGSYVGSFSCVYRLGAGGSLTEEKCDLYVYESRRQDLADEQGACIRFGNEPQEYYSPIDVQNILSASDHEPYRSAMALLKNKGNLVWKPRENAR